MLGPKFVFFNETDCLILPNPAFLDRVHRGAEGTVPVSGELLEVGQRTVNSVSLRRVRVGQHLVPQSLRSVDSAGLVSN